MSNLFLTADLHFGHRNIISYCNRPWGSVDDMRAGLIERWNDSVKSDDVVWVLGDWSLHGRELDVLPELNGRKRLIAGNHDKVWSGNTDSHKHYAKYAEHFETIGTMQRLNVSGTRVMLSHFPYFGDATDDRYHGFRLPDTGLPLIHGHVHDSYLVRMSSKGTPMVNVGVDMWDWRPAPAERVLELINRANAGFFS